MARLAKAGCGWPMTHEEISQLVGTSRETITRLLSEFQRNKLAELNGSMLVIHNHPALKTC
jgi:CRP-like cAMP-binding protein